jgi:hypothetical protein
MKCAICGEEINPLLGYVYDNPDENGDPTPQSNFYHPECIEKAIKEKQES